MVNVFLVPSLLFGISPTPKQPSELVVVDVLSVCQSLSVCLCLSLQLDGSFPDTTGEHFAYP